MKQGNWQSLAIAKLVKEYDKELMLDLNKELFTGHYASIFKVLQTSFIEVGRLPSFEALDAAVKTKAPKDILPAIQGILKSISLTPVATITNHEIVLGLKDMQLITVVDRSIEELVHTAQKKDVPKLRAVLNDIVSEIAGNRIVPANFEDAMFAPDNTRILTTGCPDTDERISGVHGLTLVAARSGAGKAQPLSSPILTPSGWKTMGDMKVGCEVIGSQGLAIKVVNVFPQGVRPIYKVSFIDGTHVMCDKDHLWQVYDRKRNAKVLTTSEILEVGVQTPPRYDKRYGTYQKQYSFTIPVTQAVEFVESKKLKIHPYVLGLLLGDGGFSQSVIKFTNASREIVDTLGSLLPKGYKLGVTMLRQGAWHTSIIKQKGTSGSFKKVLATYGIGSTLSIHKHIPKEYLLSSLEDRQALYQGLVDTDGYVKDGQLHEYSTSSKQLAEDFLDLGRGLGKMLSIKSRIPKYTYKGEVLEGQVSYRIRELKKQTKTIIAIEYSHEEEAQCIMVDSEDHLYVTEGHNLTHNSVYLLQLAIEQYMSGLNVLFLSFELSAKVLGQRMQAYISGVEFTKIIKGTTTKEEAKIIKVAMREFFNRDNTFKIVTTPMDAMELKTLIATQKALFNTDVVIIDYLNLIDTTVPGQSGAWMGLQILARDLHKMTIQKGLTIVSAVQVNIEKASKPGVPPVISTRGSSELFFSASLVIFLETVDGEAEDTILFWVLKNRLGPTLCMLFEKQFQYMKINFILEV